MEIGDPFCVGGMIRIVHVGSGRITPRLLSIIAEKDFIREHDPWQRFIFVLNPIIKRHTDCNNPIKTNSVSVVLVLRSFTIIVCVSAAQLG